MTLKSLALMLSALLVQTLPVGAQQNSNSAQMNQAQIEKWVSMGGQDAGGGNVFEVEFKSIGKEVVKKLQASNLQADQLGYEIINFMIAVQEVQVLGTNQTIVLNEAERTAVNSQNQRLIVFNNQIWALLTDKQKEMLVIHEYLRFVGVNDSDYTYTMRTIEFLKLDPERPQGPGHSRMARTFELISSSKCPFASSCRGTRFFLKSEMHIQYIALNCEYHSGRSLLTGFIHTSNARNQLIVQELPHRDSCYAQIAFAALASQENPVYITIDPQGDKYSGFISLH